MGAQWHTAILCMHQACIDPVTGEQLPANIARQQQIFCAFEGKYHEPEQEKIKAPVISLAKL
jgi:hypothetical protein